MIRRIIDSVPFLTDSSSTYQMDNLTNENDFSDVNNQIDETDRLFENNSSSSLDRHVYFPVNSNSLFNTNNVNNDVNSTVTSNIVTSTISSYSLPQNILTNTLTSSNDEENDTFQIKNCNYFKRIQSPSPHNVLDLPCSFSGEADLQPFRHRPVINKHKNEFYRNVKNFNVDTKVTNCNNIINNDVKSNETVGIMNSQTTGTETIDFDFDTNYKSTGMSNQINPIEMELELKILPFYQNLTALELKLPNKFSNKLYRRTLKKLATDYELLVLTVDNNQSLVVRKRGVLQEKQEIELAQRREKDRLKKLEQEAVRVALELKKQLQITKSISKLDTELENNHEVSCQASFYGDQTHQSEKKRKKRNRQRNRTRDKSRQRGPKKPQMVDFTMQSVPEDYKLCPWCDQFIAPEFQFGHEPICRAGVIQKRKQLELKDKWIQRNLDVEASKRQRLGLPPLKKNVTKGLNQNQQNYKQKLRHSSHKRSMSRNGKSSGKINSQTTNGLKTIESKLDEVHPNDLEAMTKLMQRLCTEPKCRLLAYGNSTPIVNKSEAKCYYCNNIFCLTHRPLGKHQNCTFNGQNELGSDQANSIACGMDTQERHEALRLALKQRKNHLRQLRERN